MSLAEKQGQIIARLSLIEDAHERLAALMSRAKKVPAPDAAQLTEENRVQGCQSRVWLTGEFANGACRWRMDSEAPMVKGLVGLLCELYEGAAPDDVIAFEPTLIEDLGIARMVSGTRIAGLASVRMRMRQLATAFATNAAR
ncbi:MAG: SufE family protein [Chthoniobacteraceae bacterium]